MVREHDAGIHEEPALDHAHGGPRKRRHLNAGDRLNGPHEFDDPDGEIRVVDLLEGKAMQLSLGRVVVRNLAHKELRDGHVDQDSREEALF